ncbi:MAG: hypothetical protein BHV97_03230 [Clostridium sp. CAG:349_48_7]|nr:MAG: hypothetical protein BHV97_03230 [Clostridium sp. CAG:349_48_7]
MRRQTNSRSPSKAEFYLWLNIIKRLCRPRFRRTYRCCGLSGIATANEISFTVESGILLMIKYY